MNRPDIRRLPKRGNPQEAVDLLLASVRENVVPSETVALDKCVGRVLAKDVFSDRNIPDYDKSICRCKCYKHSNNKTKYGCYGKHIRYQHIIIYIQIRCSKICYI